MSTWRRKAIELFPDLRAEIERTDATIYTVFFELLHRCHEAHTKGNNEELSRIYSYAEWCFRQKEKDLWNAAGVAFYEHLADHELSFREMSKWVKKDIFKDILPLFESRLSQEVLRELKKAYGYQEKS